MTSSTDAKVTTEGSARVLNEVKGRLERIETGDLPVIEKIGADGTVRRVDPTGEMIRPDPAQIEAAEAFANQHLDALDRTDQTPSTSAPAPVTVPERKGFWARILGWFSRG